MSTTRPYRPLVFAMPQDPADAEPFGRNACARCVTCGWRGTVRTSLAHHREHLPHHAIELTYAPHWGLMTFPCCPVLVAEGVQK